MIEQSDGQETENEFAVGPEPVVLMQDQEQRHGAPNTQFFHHLFSEGTLLDVVGHTVGRQLQFAQGGTGKSIPVYGTKKTWSPSGDQVLYGNFNPQIHVCYDAGGSGSSPQIP